MVLFTKSLTFNGIYVGLLRLKRLPVHHHCADYVLWFSWIIRLILSQFENRVAGARGRGQCCTITILHMNRLNKPESSFFFSDLFLASRDSSFRINFILL